MVSSHADDNFGYSNTTTIEVLRAGKVVCTLPYGGHSAHEHSSGFSSSALVVSAREPLHFYLRMTSTSNEFPPSETCTGFELPDGGTCRTLFEQSCSENECTLSSTTSLVPGTGKIRGEVSRDREPFAGAILFVKRGESLPAITDEHGAFSLDASPGAHELVVSGSDHVYSPKVSVSTRRDQDAHVSIAIECPCCRAP